jgi:preprotein translocase SecE subunit
VPVVCTGKSGKVEMARSGSNPRVARLSRPLAKRGGFRLRFFVEVWGELKKSEWPSRGEAIRMTGIVLIITTLIGLFLGGIDLILSIIGRETIGY